MRSHGVAGVAFVVAATLSAILSAGQGTWSLGGPPGTGTVTIVTASSPGVLYAGNSSGLFQSADNGLTWSLVGSPNQSTTAIAAGHGSTVYASSGYPNVTLYRSPDGGAHWSPIGSVAEGSFSVVEDPFVPSTIYRTTTTPSLVTAPSVLDRSTDGGATWTSIDPGLATAYGNLVPDPRQPGRLYLVAAYDSFGAGRVPPIPVYALFQTSDRGDTWTRLSDTPGGGSALSIDPFVTSTLYVMSFEGPFRSTDSGSTFAAITAGFRGNPSGRVLVDAVHTNNLYALAFGVSAAVATSTDAGNHWTTGFALPWGYPTDLEIDSTGQFLHAAVSVGVLDLQIPTDPGKLILDAAHPFTVTLSAVDPHTGAIAPGVATQVNDLWGYFSIPAITNNPNNPEVFVKLLDATAINGEFWFFYGGLTTLEYTLTVTDSTTGAQKTYTKAAGSECGGSDTAAFGQ
jgi:photosystem II stability/assembly factor-like uncharacterized protein